MASRYRKIDPRIWNDERFRALTDDGKLVFLFLLTHPHLTALGAMRGTIPGFAAELGWNLKRFRDAIKDVTDLGLVQVCEKAAWICVPNFLRYNEPEGPNSVTKAWVMALDLLPECSEKGHLMERCRAYLEARSKNFKDAMGHAIWDAFGDAKTDELQHAKSDPCPILEQEQEQEQEQDIPPAVDQTFGEFWVQYPMRNGKRLGKADALKKWTLLTSQDRKLALTAVRNYATSKTVSDGIGIKDPHRWLRTGKNDEPWREWIEPEQPSSTDGRMISRTCTKRVQSPGERFLHPCGQPASSSSRSNEPRCTNHLAPEQSLGVATR